MTFQNGPVSNHGAFAKNQDSNHSDINAIGIRPRHDDAEPVVAVSCKSWQAGFDVAAQIAALEKNKIVSRRAAGAFRGSQLARSLRLLNACAWSQA
jgi:hypothetical protein